MRFSIKPISLITATNNRPKTFALCEKYIGRQGYEGEIEWIVADDGTEPANCTLGQTHLRLLPQPNPVESFRHNYLAGVRAASHDLIFFIEDDDFYAAEYLSEMVKRLEKYALVGEAHARYYHVPERRYLIHPNRQHASLCQTGLRRELIDHVLVILEHDRKPHQLDGGLWKRRGIPTSQKCLLPQSRYVVGLKGLNPVAVGVDHTASELSRRGYSRDIKGDTLRKWIGDDADVYLRWGD